MSTRAVAPTVAAPAAVLTPVQRPMLQRSCDCGQHTGGGECEECKKKKKMPLQRYASGSGALPHSSPVAPPIVHEVLSSPGRALDVETRAFMEPRFRQDFSQVRVHTDERAAESARAVSAHAYTVGRHVVFGAGRFAPHSAPGRSLLKHELTHVVQQAAASHENAEIQIGEVQDAGEREASRIEKADIGESAHVGHSSPPRLQGSWDWKRAGWGALIGTGVGVGTGAIALAAGAPGLAIGLVGGSIVGGFLIGGFAGKGQTAAAQNRPPQSPPPPPGCSPDQANKITAGMRRAATMLRTSIVALSTFQPGVRGSAPSSGAGDALQRYFRSTARQVANYVRDRFVQVQDMLSRLQQPRSQRAQSTQNQPSQQQVPDVPAIACHTGDVDDTCNHAIAYVGDVRPGQTQRDSMIFCSSFFERGDLSTDELRGGVIIHEIAHAIMGGPASIQDRAYSDERFFLDLSTGEALTNADSYRMFVLRMAGVTPLIEGQFFSDFVEGCDPAQAQRLNQALRLAQRWVDVAWKVTHDHRPEWLALDYWKEQRRRYLGGGAVELIDAAGEAFNAVAGPLRMFIQARCHPQADAVCPAGRATATATGGAMGIDEIQLCPDWLSESDSSRQAILVLAEMLGGAGVHDAQARLNHAEMAKKLFDDLGQAPSLEEMLGPQPGDYPARTLPAGTERA